MFERLANFRDVGDGRVMRTGAVFRSGHLRRITERDQARLHALGITLVIDLRAPARRPRHAIEVRHVPLGPDERRRQLFGFLFGKDGDQQFRAFGRRYYRAMAFEQMPRVRELIERVASHAGPVLIHCTAGKDRTGFAAALIQLIAGMPYDQVRADYLRTNDVYAAELARVTRIVRLATLARVPRARIETILKTHPEMLDELHTSIVHRHGTVEGYLRDGCGVDGATLESLRLRLRA